MSRQPSKRVLGAMTLDELVAALGTAGNNWPYIKALMRRDPNEVGQRALAQLAQGPADLQIAGYLFEGSGGPSSPARDEAAPILRKLLRRRDSYAAAILSLGHLGLFSRLRSHRRFLDPKHPYWVRWGAVIALQTCMSRALDAGSTDTRAIESLIFVARMTADDKSDFGAVYWMITAHQMHGVPMIEAFIKEVLAGPPSKMHDRLLEELKPYTEL